MVEQRDAVALWIAHTYFLDIFDVTPRLAVLSPEKQCGKRRLLELVELLARRARLTVSMSEAYMFRLIDDIRPVLLVDEVDTIFGSRQKNDSHEGLRGLINAGFRLGATVGRIVGEGSTMVPVEFDVFAPVALAGIGHCLPDTVLDRSVIIRLRRRAPDEPVEPLRRRRAEAVTARLARRLAAWAHRTSVDEINVEPPMPGRVVDRPADTWEPLVALGDLAGGTWPDRSRAACVRLLAAKAEDMPAVGVMLLTDLRTMFSSTDRLHSFDVVQRLNEDQERPWSTWNHGNGIRQVDLATRLRDYDVHSRDVRVGDVVKRGYRAKDLHDAWVAVPTSCWFPFPSPHRRYTCYRRRGRYRFTLSEQGCSTRSACSTPWAREGGCSTPRTAAPQRERAHRPRLSPLRGPTRPPHHHPPALSRPSRREELLSPLNPNTQNPDRNRGANRPPEKRRYPLASTPRWRHPSGTPAPATMGPMSSSTNPAYTATAWRRARAAARRRDGDRCTVCGAGREDGVRLDVDHITPMSLGGDPYNLANLRTMCRRCHAAFGRRKPRARKQQPRRQWPRAARRRIPGPPEADERPRNSRQW